jgi:hypothetical protein
MAAMVSSSSLIPPFRWHDQATGLPGFSSPLRFATYIFKTLTWVVIHSAKRKRAKARMDRKKSSHPAHCRECHGAGWEPGPPIPGRHHGSSFEYTTVQPCTNVWWDDDPTVNEYGMDTADPIPWHHPRGLAALARGHEQGQHELFVLSDGKLGRSLAGQRGSDCERYGYGP